MSGWENFSVAEIEIAVIPGLAGGVIVLAGGTGGIYWLAAGIRFCFVKAMGNAWVLLVEIDR